MLSQKVGVPSFFLLHSIPLYKCTTVFIIHLSTYGHLDCFQILATVNSTAMNMGVHKFKKSINYVSFEIPTPPTLRILLSQKFSED